MLQGSPTSCLFHLIFLVQACVTWADAHCLCLNLMVLSQSRPGQPWCQAQGSLDGKPFLQCVNNCNKVRHWGFLGEKVKATKSWTELPQMLGEMGQELRMILPDIKLETRTRGPLTLQAKLCCQQEAGQYTGASWEFSFNGQPAILLDTMHKKWTVIDPAASGTKEDWEKNKELADYFRKTSMGDCNHWLREFLEPMEKVLEPTELSTPLGPLEEKVNATNACTELPQTQGERTREHSMNLSDVSLEKNRTRDTPQPSTAWSIGSIIGIIALAAIVMTIIIGAGIYFV